MRRREFLMLLGAANAFHSAARAQHAGRTPTIGILGTATPSTWQVWTDALERRLRELGWTEGRTVAFAYRWSDGNNDRLEQLATDLARIKPDVIVTTGTGVLALKKAAPAIPVVFAIGRDPVADGLVQSLARPGGLVTGLSSQATDLGGKRLELLREIVPSARRIAVVAEVNDLGAVLERREVEASAKKLQLETVLVEIRHPDQDLAAAFQQLKGKVDAVYCGAGAIITVNRRRIFAQAMSLRLPTISGLRIYAQAGSLITYGPDYADLFRRAGDHVDKILRGAKPADIPVEQPTKFELVINLTTAKALALDIPTTVLARADEVIE